MTNVIRLSTAAISYITVRRHRGAWAIVLATPFAGRSPLRTIIATATTYDAARDLGRRVASEQQRPFREAT